MDTRLVEVGAIGFCRAIVLAEDVLEHVDPQPAGLVAGVIADTGAVTVLVIEVVVRVSRAVGVVVKASHANLRSAARTLQRIAIHWNLVVIRLSPW